MVGAAGSMAAMPSVARFNVTSVKSTMLRHPDQIELTPNGVEGDHDFLFLEADGRRISTGRKAPFLGIRATHDSDDDRLTLELPDGTRVEGPVTAVGSPLEVEMYDRAIKVRAVDGPFASAISRYIGREIVLARAEPPHRARPTRPVSIVSLASVAELGRRGGRGDVPDPRRFRMLIEVNGCSSHEEDSWSGGLIRIGEALVRVGDGIPRCLVTTLHPETGEHDYPTLDVLATYRKRDGELQFGVYGDVERPGRIRVGDDVGSLDE